MIPSGPRHAPPTGLCCRCPRSESQARWLPAAKQWLLAALSCPTRACLLHGINLCLCLPVSACVCLSVSPAALTLQSLCKETPAPSLYLATHLQPFDKEGYSPAQVLLRLLTNPRVRGSRALPSPIHFLIHELRSLGGTGAAHACYASLRPADQRVDFLVATFYHANCVSRYVRSHSAGWKLGSPRKP